MGGTFSKLSESEEDKPRRSLIRRLDDKRQKHQQHAGMSVVYHRPVTQAAQDLPAAAHQPSLLTLPPELRNTIYRYALIERHQVTIDLTTQIPSLLQSCRQTRDEGTGIWVNETEFRYVIRDLDASLSIRWWRSRAPYEAALTNAAVCISPPHNWENLIAWLEASYKGECPSLVTGDGRTKRRTLAYHAFDLVTLYKRKGMTWEEASEALEIVRGSLGTQDARWLAN